jgi:hypothetical protein
VMKSWFPKVAFKCNFLPLHHGRRDDGLRGGGAGVRVAPAVRRELRLRVGKYAYKPFCLSSETVLPIKRNRSTYQVKPFYLSSETVLPFK